MGTLSTMPIKKSILGLQNPVTSAHKEFESLKRASVNLINVVTGKSEFSTTNHVRAAREEHSEGGKSRDEANNIKLEETLQDLPKTDRIILLFL